MNDRQFLWGLSNGVIVFAIAGMFWLGLGIGSVATKVGWQICAVSTALQVGVCAVLLWAAVRLRRKSGFHASELRQRDGRRKPETAAHSDRVPLDGGRADRTHRACRVGLCARGSRADHLAGHCAGCLSSSCSAREYLPRSRVLRHGCSRQPYLARNLCDGDTPIRRGVSRWCHGDRFLALSGISSRKRGQARSACCRRALGGLANEIVVGGRGRCCSRLAGRAGSIGRRRAGAADCLHGPNLGAGHADRRGAGDDPHREAGVDST